MVLLTTLASLLNTFVWVSNVCVWMVLLVIFANLCMFEWMSKREFSRGKSQMLVTVSEIQSWFAVFPNQPENCSLGLLTGCQLGNFPCSNENNYISIKFEIGVFGGKYFSNVQGEAPGWAKAELSEVGQWNILMAEHRAILLSCRGSVFESWHGKKIYFTISLITLHNNYCLCYYRLYNK